MGLYLEPSLQMLDFHMASGAAHCGIGCSPSSKRLPWFICYQTVMWHCLFLLGDCFFIVVEPLIFSLLYLLPENFEKFGQEFNSLCVPYC